MMTLDEKFAAARPIATEGIKQFEGCHLTSYVFPGESWATIGWGKAIPLSQHPKKITQQEADRLFDETLRGKESALRHEIPQAVLEKLTVGGLAGILMFRYNVKDSAWLDVKCNTRKVLVAGDIKNFWKHHRLWVHGEGGKVLGGLKRRRRVENEIGNDIPISAIKEASWYRGLY